MSDVSIWLPLYVGDMQSKITRLDTLQIGALHLLTMDYWKNGAVPDVASVLANITKMSAAKFKSIRAGLLSCGVFEIIEGHWVSPYLDSLREAATENKKDKSKQAQEAAAARWEKERQRKQSEADALLEHKNSNADAMQTHMRTHAKTDAESMQTQCPSSSSSSINNTHTNAGEFLPDLEQLNARLKMAGGQAVTAEQLSQTLVTFNPHYETHSLSDNQRLGKLVTWIKGDQDKAKRPSSKPAKSSAGAVNQNFPDAQYTIPPTPETLAAIKKMQDEMEDCA